MCHGVSTPLSFDTRLLLCDSGIRHEFMVTSIRTRMSALDSLDSSTLPPHGVQKTVGQFFSMEYHISSLPLWHVRIYNAELRKPSISTLKITVSSPFIPA